MNSFSRSQNYYFFALLFWGLLLGAMYALTFKMHYDIRQMIDRGVVFAIQGKIIFFGNAASGGMGSVPGGLSSLLVGIPLKFWYSPYSVLISISIFHLISLALIWNAIKNKFNPQVMFLFLVFFWLSPWRVSEIYLWNPSYMLFAVALHFWSGVRMAEKRSALNSGIHILAIVFAFQIHNSSIILALISGLLFLKGQLKIHWPAAVGIAILGIASLIPYIYSLVDSPELSPVVRGDEYFMFRGLLYIFPILKAVWYWVRFTSTVFPKPLLQNIEMAWIGQADMQSVGQMVFAGIKYGVAAITAIFSFRIQYKYFQSKKKWFTIKKQDNSICGIDSYVCAGFVAMIIAAAMSPIDLLYWHLWLLFPIALIPALQYFSKDENKKWTKKLVILGLVYFSAYNIIAALGSEKHSLSQRPQQEFLREYGDQKNSR